MATSVRHEPLSKPEQIKRFVDNARRHGQPDVACGKRRRLRVSSDMRVEVTADPDSPSKVTAAAMHNVSQRGLAFWSRQRFAIRTPVFIREFRSDGAGEWLPLRVRHCTVGLRGFLIGAEFEDPPTEKNRLPGRNTSRRLQESLRIRRLHL